MLGWFSTLNPIILDVVVASILVLIAFFGALRGFKKTLISFLIIALSLFLGFCSYTDPLKRVIATKIFNIAQWVPAGSTNVFIFSVSLFTSFFVSLVLFVIFELLLTVLKVLIGSIVKRKSRKEAKGKSALGRVFAGLFAFVYQGAILIVLLLVMNSNIVGMKEVVKESSVTKFLVTTSEKVLNKKDTNLTTKIIVKVVNGDVLYKVEDNVIESYKYADARIIEVTKDSKYIEKVEDDTLSEEEAKKLMKERLVDLSHMAVISFNFTDINYEAQELFPKIAEEWMTIINREWNELGLSKIEFTFNECAEIRLNLKNAGVSEEVLGWFDEITIGK